MTEEDNLMAFSFKEGGLEGLTAEIQTVHVDKKELFPLDLEVSERGIVKWLEHRVIPKNRAFVDEILKTLGLSANNTKGIIDASKGLSLNDSFWVVPEDFNCSFSDYNLYENRFSEALSLVAYTGAGASREVFSTSPELTTNGMLRKAISFEDVCREVMGAKQKRQLRRMIGFRFQRHPHINLPEERLCAIEEFLQYRTRELLAIPKACG